MGENYKQVPHVPTVHAKAVQRAKLAEWHEGNTLCEAMQLVSGKLGRALACLHWELTNAIIPCNDNSSPIANSLTV